MDHCKSVDPDYLAILKQPVNGNNKQIILNFGGEKMSGLKVLIVDDEVVFCENMAKLLNTRGYQVDAVNGGEEAIRVLQKDLYDVVVLDLKMPGMNGINTLQKINELGITSQTIMLTGHGCVDSAMEAIKLGAYDYIPKPCEVDELCDMIEKSQQNKGRDTKKKKKSLDVKLVEGGCLMPPLPRRGTKGLSR